MPTAEKGMADTAPDQGRRPDRGERTSQGDAHQHHGRSPEIIRRSLQSSGLSRHGGLDGAVGIDVAADADAAATAADGDAVRSAAAAAAWSVRMIRFAFFRSCCMGEKNPDLCIEGYMVHASGYIILFTLYP
jgi:hypothetical protein